MADASLNLHFYLYLEKSNFFTNFKWPTQGGFGMETKKKTFEMYFISQKANRNPGPIKGRFWSPLLISSQIKPNFQAKPKLSPYMMMLVSGVGGG